MASIAKLWSTNFTYWICRIIRYSWVFSTHFTEPNHILSAMQCTCQSTDSKNINSQSVDEQFKVNAALCILSMMFNVLCPCLTPDVDDNSVGRFQELYHDKWSSIALLVQVWVVVDRISSRWPELQRPNILLINWIFTLACHVYMHPSALSTQLWWAVRTVVRHRHPVEYLV